MMKRALKSGERVRITSANNMPGFHPGDLGTIKEGPYPAPQGGEYYIVQMDKDVGSGPTIFLAEEIESSD